MPASLNEIKVRIASTRKTSQITGAMQMVSAAKLTRSEQNAKSFQVYAQKVRSITTDLIGSELSDGSTNPMLIKRPVKKTGYIVITSDKGLVGGYNSSILKSVMQMLKDDHENPDEFVIIALGGMGADFFKARDINSVVFLINLHLMRCARLLISLSHFIKMNFLMNYMCVTITMSIL